MTISQPRTAHELLWALYDAAIFAALVFANMQSVLWSVYFLNKRRRFR